LSVFVVRAAGLQMELTQTSGLRHEEQIKFSNAGKAGQRY